jgi:hypothetical protein
MFYANAAKTLRHKKEGAKRGRLYDSRVGVQGTSRITYMELRSNKIQKRYLNGLAYAQTRSCLNVDGARSAQDILSAGSRERLHQRLSPSLLQSLAC